MPTVNELIIELEELQIQESHIIQAIKSALEQRKEKTTDIFQVGDRVRITNFVRPPITRRGTNHSTEADQTATITKVEKDRISFTTDSGIATWRKPTNIEIIKS